MNADEDDFRIGVPSRGGSRAAVAPGVAAERVPSPHEPLELRPGETELGRPVQAPADLAPLSAHDLAALKKLGDEQAARDMTEAELLLHSDPSGLGWLGWFGSPMLLAFFLGITGIFGIFLFNQTASLLQTLATIQEDWLRWSGYAGLALLGLCPQPPSCMQPATAPPAAPTAAPISAPVRASPEPTLLPMTPPASAPPAAPRPAP